MNEVNSKWFYEPNTSSVRRYVDQDNFLFEHADGQRMADALNACEGIDDLSSVPQLLDIIRFAVSRFTDPHMVSKDPAAVRLRDMAREVGIQWPWGGRA
jgi:hypothetical protein